MWTNFYLTQTVFLSHPVSLHAAASLVSTFCMHRHLQHGIAVRRREKRMTKAGIVQWIEYTKENSRNAKKYADSPNQKKEEEEEVQTSVYET